LLHTVLSRAVSHSEYSRRYQSSILSLSILVAITSMSTRLPTCQQSLHSSPREANQGALFITPIDSNSLEPRICPICYEPYSGAHTPGQARGPEEEGAVSVDMIAEWQGLRRLCGHVIGRRCLEKYITSSGAWRNKCPICRCIWFGEVAPANEQQHRQRARQALPRLRRSRRIAAQRGASQHHLGQAISERDSVRQCQGDERHQLRSVHLTRQILDALEVGDGTGEVKGTLEEVEQRIMTLYEGADV
jgi:hypothetical protein